MILHPNLYGQNNLKHFYTNKTLFLSVRKLETSKHTFYHYTKMQDYNEFMFMIKRITSKKPRGLTKIPRSCTRSAAAKRIHPTPPTLWTRAASIQVVNIDQESRIRRCVSYIHPGQCPQKLWENSLDSLRKLLLYFC